jgi:hypothetical protein
MREKLVIGPLIAVAAIVALPVGAVAQVDSCRALEVGCPTPPPPAPGPAPDPGGQETPDQPVPPPGKGFGFNGQLYLAGVAATPADEIDRARTAGATVYRVPVAWRFIQYNPSDPAFPANPDPASYAGRLVDFYATAMARNLTLVMTVGWAPAWASKYASCLPLDSTCQSMQYQGQWGGLALPPDANHLDEWETFVEAVKRRFPRATIEVWNEPNVFWKDPNYQGGRDFSASPESFADIQCTAYRASKAVNSDPVLAAGWAWNRYREYLGRVYAAGGKDCWDRANLHFYPGSSMTFGTGSGLAIALRDTHDLRAYYGDADPLWITETGYTTSGTEVGVSEAAQCDGARRIYNRLATMSEVAMVLFHTLRDKSFQGDGDPNSTGYGYGFMRENWSPKPVYDQFQRQAGNGGAACPAL